ncbi:MAG: hypothetical protein V3W14_07305 [Candidatus Neomarinimicrobiota bacterium]
MSKGKAAPKQKQPKPTAPVPAHSCRSREELTAGFYDVGGEKHGLPPARILLRVLEVLIDIRDALREPKE